MRIIDSLDEMTETARGWLAGGTVGFVAINSRLHEGHRVLIHAARAASEIVVVCFLDQTLLFGLNQYDNYYVHDLQHDLRLLGNNNTDIIFLPRREDMYPPGFSTFVTPLGSVAEHMQQMPDGTSLRTFATTMTKLFHLVRPDLAFFGQKDAEQIAVLRQIVHDLHIDVTIRVLSTVREHDGLAMSSRNQRLSTRERQAAAVLHQTLLQAREHIEAGERRVMVIEKMIRDCIVAVPLLSVESITICHPDTLAALTEITPNTLILVNVRIGIVHLSDNILWMNDGQWRV